MKAPDQHTYAHPAWLILILSLAPTIVKSGDSNRTGLGDAASNAIISRVACIGVEVASMVSA